MAVFTLHHFLSKTDAYMYVLGMKDEIMISKLYSKANWGIIGMQLHEHLLTKAAELTNIHDLLFSNTNAQNG